MNKYFTYLYISNLFNLFILKINIYQDIQSTSPKSGQIEQNSLNFINKKIEYYKKFFLHIT